MPLWTLLMLAIGLSADAFAVSIGKGLQIRRDAHPTALLLGTAFGFAQAAMPIVGWLLGRTFADRVSMVAPWIAFALLAAVGGKMLWEAVRGEADEVLPEDFANAGESEIPRSRAAGASIVRGIGLAEVVVLAIATSIDALAVGVSLAVLDVSIWWSAATIGIVTFALSYLAVHLGHRAGARFRTPAEVIGALILIGIGVRVLVVGVVTNG